MIQFDDLDLLAFFETEAVPDPDEPTILRYAVTARTGMKLLFTIDSPLSCVHLLIAHDEAVLVDMGIEGVVSANVRGKGNEERLECEVVTPTVEGKMTISWKSTPHLQSHLLDRGI